MIRWLLLLLIITAAAVVQTTLADLAAIGRATPDLTLALAVYFGLSYDLRDAFLPAWLLGLFRDAFSAGPVGMYGIIFLLLALLLGYVRTYAFHDKPGVTILATALASAAASMAGLAMLSLLHPVPPAGHVLARSLLDGAYSAAAVFALPAVLDRPCRWIGLGKT